MLTCEKEGRRLYADLGRGRGGEKRRFKCHL